MFKYMYDLGMLYAESQQVIFLRMLKMAGGGSVAEREARLMVSEKLLAASDANIQLMKGATPESVVKRYRKKVRANARRLMK